MYISNLIVEVTRICQFSCGHCLRGEQEKMNLKFAYIDSLLNQVSGIGDVTFSGGEPTLHIEAIQYFLDQCIERGITIDGFYIATNGYSIKIDFIILCLKLYAYCEDKERCSIQVSNDMYHGDEGGFDDELLAGLSFYSKRNEEDYAEINLIDEGLANENGIASNGRLNSVSEIETQENFNDAEIYLNCKGKIINGCDWSYSSQDEYIICDVKNLKEYYNNLEAV